MHSRARSCSLASSSPGADRDFVRRQIGNGGRFTKECREIYELVLEMQEVHFLIRLQRWPAR